MKVFLVVAIVVFGDEDLAILGAGHPGVTDALDFVIAGFPQFIGSVELITRIVSGAHGIAVNFAFIVVAVAIGIAEGIGVPGVGFVVSLAEFIDTDVGVLDIGQFAL